MKNPILVIFALGFLCAIAFAEGQADLAVSVSDSQDPVVLGANFSYVVIVTNNGPALANNLVLSDVLNANGTFQSVAAPEEWKCTDPQQGTQSSVSCSAEQLEAGKSATFTLTVKPTTAGMMTDTANITSSVADPHDANNSDYEDTTILAMPADKQ
jgi:uncharacterized repeat protein (TIGR01451 family)